MSGARSNILSNTFGWPGAPRGGVHGVRYDNGTVTLQAAALPWDAFALELWGALLNGGCCVLPQPGPLGPEELREAIQEGGVNTLFLTTSLFNTLLDVDPSCLRGLRLLMTGGELVSVRHMRRFLSAHPCVSLVHAYGPVEGTVYTTTHHVGGADVGADATSVPIGRPVRGTQVHVLDATRAPVAPGEVGELYVAGSGLCFGYLGNARETARRFVPVGGVPGSRAYRTGDLVRIDGHGVLHYVARADRQVKLRGVRIEPGEIEIALRDCPGVAEVAVVPVRDPSERVVALHAWYTGEETDPLRLRAWLRERLPEASVPAIFGRLDALPRGHSGKIDTRALERRAAAPVAPPAARRDDPATAAETVVELLGEVLGNSIKDEQATFLELGGTSLSAITLASRLSDRTGRRIHAADVLDGGSAAALVQRVDEAPAAHPATASVDDPDARPVAVPAAAAVLALFHIEQELDRDALRLAMDDVYARHPELSRWAHLRSGAAAVRELAGLVDVPAELLDLMKREVPPADVPALELTLARCTEHVGGWALAVAGRTTTIDEWSLRVLLQDVSAAYRARVSGQIPHLPAERTLFTQWAADIRAAETAGIARDREAPPSGSPWRPAGGASAGDGMTIRQVAVPARLRSYARARKLTITAAFLAALAGALKTATDAEDLCIAVPAARRDAPGVDRTVGSFSTVLPVRLRATDGPFAERARSAQETLFAAMRASDRRHSPDGTDVPWEITDCHALLNRHLHPVPRLDLRGARIRRVEQPIHANACPVTVDVRPGTANSLAVSLLTDRAALTEVVARTLYAAFEEQLAASTRSDGPA